MRKLLVATIAITVLSPIPVHAAKTIPYTNQAEGQFCKTGDKGKKVILPDGSTLTCKLDGSKYRWQAPLSVPYVNQREGQFCKKVDEGKKVTLPEGSTLICKSDGSRTRWQAA